jgi:hypothetical protein
MSPARLARCFVRASVGVAAVTLLAACGANSASQATTGGAPSTQSTMTPTKPAPSTTTTTSAPSPRPITIMSFDGKQKVGVLTLTSIERTTSVSLQFGDVGPGDYLVIQGEFENTTNNTPIRADDVLGIGLKPVPCSHSNLLCNGANYNFSKGYGPGDYPENSSEALGGQTVPYGIYINLNPGSVRQDPSIKNLGAFWIVPREHAAESANTSFGFQRRDALQLSKVWGSSVITYG